MQTPPKADLETLAIRLGCPPAAIDGGVVFRHEGLEQAWYLVVGSRPLVATQGFGRVYAAWCMARPGTKEDPAAAFWSLWDSVGDLDPETLQARREAEVAGKRYAAPKDDPGIDYKRKFERLREVFTKHHPAWSVCSCADAEIARIAEIATTPQPGGMWLVHDGPEEKCP